MLIPTALLSVLCRGKGRGYGWIHSHGIVFGLPSIEGQLTVGAGSHII